MTEYELEYSKSLSLTSNSLFAIFFLFVTVISLSTTLSVSIFMALLECFEFYVIGNCINLSLLITRFRLTFEGGLHGSHFTLVHRVWEYYFEGDEQVSKPIRSLMERHS